MPETAQNKVVSHEYHTSFQQSFVVVSAGIADPYASALGSCPALFPTRGSKHVAELVSAETVGQGAERMGRTSAKFAPKMEDEDGQNPIQSAAICQTQGTDDCFEASAVHRVHRAVEKADPASSPALRSTQR